VKAVRLFYTFKMKKITLLAFSLFTIVASAQTSIKLFQKNSTVSVTPNQTLLAVTSPTTLITITLDVQNTSVVSHSYSTKRYDMVINSVDATDKAIPNFCFAGQCYGTGTMISPFQLELKAGERSNEVFGDTAFFSLDADLIEASVKGYSLVKYTVYDEFNVNDSVQFTVQYNTPTTGIKESGKKASKLDIYPNPVKDIAYLTYNASTSSRLTLINSLGEVVYQKEISEGKNTISIDLQNLSAGIYIAQLKEGDSITTKKLIVQ
jgi:hypothetical protein